MNSDLELHQHYKEESIAGRYLALAHIEPLLKKLPASIVGYSVLQKPIYKLELGTGATKILMWSQMHGNESTTTKALFDFINYLNANTTESKMLLQNFTFCLLPMLNPDGAAAYTRENANGIDLNRDAQNRSQPESIVLRQTFDAFQPNFCYNLHDQRTIYGVGETNKPATISFLAPAYNQERHWNENRSKAAAVIVAMNNQLQKHIPGQVGRYDDGFNINCVGDTFQFLNVPTILFEAGHFPDDYEREITRKFIFVALFSSIHFINENDIVRNEISEYLNIPQNKVSFYDFVCKNIKINYDIIEKRMNFALQLKEVVVDCKIDFVAHIAQIDALEHYYGHIEIDAEGEIFANNKNKIPEIDEIASFSIGNSIKFIDGKMISS